MQESARKSRVHEHSSKIRGWRMRWRVRVSIGAKSSGQQHGEGMAQVLAKLLLTEEFTEKPLQQVVIESEDTRHCGTHIQIGWELADLDGAQHELGQLG